ncbi:hypothetical protein HC031_10230 [Planosporangium thailandense]|uniref:DUF11 domain-containing protein n=1 Tax=Planosporangium thailandense TaxID=765197 RepID=A0ABX0XY49_9ACTN|nr:hypothetical protein [Planosporangium thailandense]NJC70084.1 hypothetical protein [Planosporangium thailandense]
MSEFDDLTLREAFSQFHTDALTAVPPQDVAGVRAIARRRRATRAGVIGAMAALVLAVPVAAYALVGRSDSGPPAVRPSLSTSPSASASPSASPSASASTAPPAPDGKISPDELGDATLDIPAWPAQGNQCATKRQKFTGGQTRQVNDHTAVTMIWKVVYADVDHDGAQETVALLGCALARVDYQVAVFDRNSAGDIVTLGQVVREDASIQHMFDVRGEADGSVSVQVGDVSVCCGVHQDQVIHQWRRYAWDGQRFHQVDGPTAFPRRPDLSITATDVTLGPLSNGVRHGSTTVTVRNVGPFTVQGMDLTVSPYVNGSQPAAVETFTNLGKCEYGGTGSAKALGCRDLTPLAPGASVTYTFQFDSPQANDQVIPTAPRSDATWSAEVTMLAASGTSLTESPADTNNSAALKVSRVD